MTQRDLWRPSRFRLLLVLELGFLLYQDRSECTVCYLFDNTLYGHDATPSVPHPHKVSSFRLGDSAYLSALSRDRTPRGERMPPTEATATWMVNWLISLLRLIREIFSLCMCLREEQSRSSGKSRSESLIHLPHEAKRKRMVTKGRNRNEGQVHPECL